MRRRVCGEHERVRGGGAGGGGRGCEQDGGRREGAGGRGQLHQPGKLNKVFMKKESKSVGLEEEDAMNQVRWRVGVGEIAVRVG